MRPPRQWAGIARPSRYTVRLQNGPQIASTRQPDVFALSEPLGSLLVGTWNLPACCAPLIALELPGEYFQYPGSWSPDGITLAFVEFHLGSGFEILLLDVRNRRITPFSSSQLSREEYPEFSPDGRWLAYGSDESGLDEVYVRPFPSPGAKWQLSRQGGTEPLWARNLNNCSIGGGIRFGRLMCRSGRL